MVGDPGRARAWSLCGLLTLTFGLVSPSLARAQAAPPGATPAAASKPATPEPAEDPDAPGSAELRERVFGDDIAVLQRRYFRKRGRVAVAGGGVASVNDVLVSHLGAGGALRYFVGERHGLAARVMAYRNFDSPVRQSVQQDLQQAL